MSSEHKTIIRDFMSLCDGFQTGKKVIFAVKYCPYEDYLAKIKS